MPSRSEKFAYVTLITKSTYLAGVILLGYTLEKYHSKYPLVVLYTDAVTEDGVKALESEAEKSNLVVRHVDPVLPRDSVKLNLIAERFADTWTKFRVFQLFEYDRVCYLDADMMIFKNMDAIFDIELEKDWIAANHACVCNLDQDPWSPPEWNKENCAYTPTQHPEALTNPTKVTPESRPTHHILNAGMFVCYPTEELSGRLINFFNTTPNLGSYRFADQDLLNEFFYNKWKSVGWQYNALKTMRYWHTNIWRDEEVCNLHYIVDKPWSNRVDANGVAGYLGRDGATHSWWWEEYEKWVQDREASGAAHTLDTMRTYVAKPLSGKASGHAANGQATKGHAENGHVKA